MHFSPRKVGANLTTTHDSGGSLNPVESTLAADDDDDDNDSLSFSVLMAIFQVNLGSQG